MMSSIEQGSKASRPAKRHAPNDEDAGLLIGSGRAKACTACRQVKVRADEVVFPRLSAALYSPVQLKCDSAETFPASCSRCSSRELDCKQDSNFKRVPTRQLVILDAIVGSAITNSLLQQIKRNHIGIDGPEGDSEVPVCGSEYPLPRRQPSRICVSRQSATVNTINTKGLSLQA